MADKSKIEWTDATWNPVNGCTVLSPGCTNCYAMKQAHRFPPRQGLTRKTNGGMVWTGEVRFNEAVLDQPLRWRRARMIFVCAHGDLFHESVPDEWIDRVFAVMAHRPQHTFQVLTKRSARMREYLEKLAGAGEADLLRRGFSIPLCGRAIFPLTQVWLGVSVEDQARADERIPDLLATPAAVRWLSCEPLLGPVDLTRIEPPHCTWLDALEGREHIGPAVVEADAKLDWIVAGGESGPGSRPMHPDWARSLRDQCAAAGVPFFFKQWGEWEGGGPGNFQRSDCRGLTNWDGEHFSVLIGKKRAGRLLDGVTHETFPQVPS
jgi:protein gp37